MKPLAVTMGEPHSVSAYLVVKAWEERAYPFVYLGHDKLIREIDASLPVRLVQSAAEAMDVFQSALPILPLQSPVHGSLKIQSDKDSAAIRESIGTAMDITLKRETVAVLTCPIRKKSLQMEGMGQTEYIARRLGCTNFAMMAMDGELRVVLATTHIPVKNIVLTTENIKNQIRVTTDFLKTKAFHFQAKSCGARTKSSCW